MAKFKIKSGVDNLANKQSPPLTEEEILSIYRNEFYKIDDPQYFGVSILKPRYYDKQGFKALIKGKHTMYLHEMIV